VLALLRILCATQRSSKSVFELPTILQVCSLGYAL
jgi:hypothetical protein